MKELEELKTAVDSLKVRMKSCGAGRLIMYHDKDMDKKCFFKLIWKSISVSSVTNANRKHGTNSNILHTMMFEHTIKQENIDIVLSILLDD